MSKLDKKPMQQAQLSKSSHDLSHVFDFTSSTGMILPLEHDVLLPGDSIQCKIDLSQTRTMPLQSAAYLDLDLHVDYFFVPMSLLWSGFTSYIYRIKDNFTSAIQDVSMLPLLKLEDLKTWISSNVIHSKVHSGIYANDFDRLGKGALRLLEHLGYGTMNADGGISAYNPTIFPYALLAYNAIYQYYFRNDEYENFNNSDFNVDVYTQYIPDHVGSTPLCQLRYRDKYHDYFTSVKSSPIVSGNNILDGAGALSLAKSWLSREIPVSSRGVINSGTIGSTSTQETTSPNFFGNSSDSRTNFGFTVESFANTLTVSNTLNGSDINTANLRALFANEKLWTITGMNRKQYDAQTLAHFGYDVPTDVLHQVQHLGHHLYNVKVGEVISTAGTSENPLATVAGKGYAFENNDAPIRFTAPCHGVFMAVYSSAIHRNYFNGFRKENAIGGWQDFYFDEFDNLGMQPLFDFEISQKQYLVIPGSTQPYNFGKIVGWQYRYEQFKRRYDRTTCAFGSHWQITSSQSPYQSQVFYGPFSSWASSEIPLDDYSYPMTFVPNSQMMWCLKENPSELNSLMLVAYDPEFYQGSDPDDLDYFNNPWQCYATDPLVHHGLISYHKLSVMSTYSMPKLG